MVGVDGVGIVAGEEEAAGHLLAVLLPLAQGLADPFQGVFQEGGGRALLGLAAHLLIVKKAIDGDGLALPRREEGRQPGEGALQVVQPGGGEETVPLHALLRVVEGQVGGEDILLPAGQGHGKRRAEEALLLPYAPEGQKVHGGVPGVAVVGLAVHVDGHVGDHGARAPQVQKPGLDARAFAQQHPARDAQGPVHPGAHQHAAVFLHGETPAAAAGELGVLLDLEGGAVAVGGGHQKAPKLLPRPEGDEGGAVPGHIVALAGSESPVLPLREGPKSGGTQRLRAVGNGVVGRGAGGDIVKELPVHKGSSRFPPRRALILPLLYPGRFPGARAGLRRGERRIAAAEGRVFSKGKSAGALAGNRADGAGGFPGRERGEAPGRRPAGDILPHQPPEPPCGRADGVVE